MTAKRGEGHEGDAPSKAFPRVCWSAPCAAWDPAGLHPQALQRCPSPSTPPPPLPGGSSLAVTTVVIAEPRSTPDDRPEGRAVLQHPADFLCLKAAERGRAQRWAGGRLTGSGFRVALAHLPGVSAPTLVNFRPPACPY